MNNPDDELQQAKAGAFVEQERNRGLARQLAEIQENLIEKLLTLRRENHEQFEEVGGYYDDGNLWLSANDILNGTPDVIILLEHDVVGNKNISQKVGVNTHTVLNLGLYTDRETWEAVRQDEAFNWEGRFGFTLDEVKEAVVYTFTAEEVNDVTFTSPSFSNDYGTYYFVDRDGNFAKVVGIPEKFTAGRCDLQIEGHPIGGVATVHVSMLPRDFVIMKMALGIFERKLDNAKPL